MPVGRAGSVVRAGLRARPRGWRAEHQPDRRRAWYRHLFRSPLVVVSLALLSVLTAAAAAAPIVAPHDPAHIDPSVRLRSPSIEHPLGTDDLGRDILSRLIYGGRVSLAVGLLVTAGSAVIGSVLGLVAGYYRVFDGPIMRVLEGVMAFPGILLAIAVVVALGPRLMSIVVALVLVYAPVVARLMRAMTLVIGGQPYVDGARATGLSDRAILWRYIFANAVSPLIVQCTFIAAYSILAEASLSFLGASVDPETPTWGNMLRDGHRLLGRAWWMAVGPGVVLFVTVMAATLVGEGLRDALDPRSKERRHEGIVS